MTQAPLATGSRTVADIDRAVGRGIQDHTFSAATCVASVQGGIMHRSALGTLFRPPPPRKVDHDTLFDLASLTKPLGTALVALFMVARHRLELSATVHSVLRDFSAPHFGRITVDMLLDHTSGLPASVPLYKKLAEADRVLHPDERLCGTRKAVPWFREQVAALPLEAEPGSKTVYSDMGFMVLAWMLEEMAGKPLDAFLSQEIFGPLGLDDTLFFVRQDAPPKKAKMRTFAATEQCAWRQKLLQGEVHDPNAWSMGGVAGHAGLFGTASAVWRLAQMLLECHQGKESFFHTGTVSRFWARSRRLETTRTLGWDTPTVLESSAGKRLSRTAVGHLGFTGTSIWIDYAASTIGVLLTNAAHPSPDNKKVPMNKLRARVYDLIASHASLGPPPPELDDAWTRLVRR